jgi:hypothetical protein
MADALLTKLRDAYKKKDLAAGKTLLAQIKVAPAGPGPRLSHLALREHKFELLGSTTRQRGCER